MGSEPYTLRGIPSKGMWALMTRLSPSAGGGPGAQPHIGGTPNMSVSKFSFHTHYSVIFINRECSINQYNVSKCSNLIEDKSYHQGSGPSVTCV